MAWIGNVPQSAISAQFPTFALWSDHRLNPIPAQSPRRRSRPYLNLRPHRIGKIDAFGTARRQFRRYKNARITVFDKGRSLFALAKAAGADHYDLGGDTGSPGLCPLAKLDSHADIVFAEDWIEACFQLQQGTPPTPRQKEEIHRAVKLMQETKDGQGRSLTDFVTTVQDKDIRAALGTYTIEGSLGHLLDARSDGIKASAFTVFEIEDLMALGERNLIPVLLYLFRHFERSLSGAPSLLLLDEAWVMLGHPVFREKIREWLKVLRKANCAVVLATQSLSDAVRSGILDVLLESCPTKILLPNEEADKGGTSEVPGPLDLYRLIGLNGTEIDLLKSAVKKRHYYYTSVEGRRLFELGRDRSRLPSPRSPRAKMWPGSAPSSNRTARIGPAHGSPKGDSIPTQSLDKQRRNNMKPQFKAAILLACATLVAATTEAAAQLMYCSNCSTEATQLLNFARLGYQLTTQGNILRLEPISSSLWQLILRLIVLFP